MDEDSYSLKTINISDAYTINKTLHLFTSFLALQTLPEEPLAWC